MRLRIYDTGVMKSGKRVVQSGSPLEWFFVWLIKWIFKIMFFCMFFWIIIPLKLFKK